MNESRKTIENLKKKLSEIDKKDIKINKSNNKSGLNLGFRISTEIVAALIVGVGIGLLVDNYFHTSPIGLILFFILGAFAGFLNVYRVMRRIEKQKQF